MVQTKFMTHKTDQIVLRTIKMKSLAKSQSQKILKMAPKKLFLSLLPRKAVKIKVRSLPMVQRLPKIHLQNSNNNLNKIQKKGNMRRHLNTFTMVKHTLQRIITRRSSLRMFKMELPLTIIRCSSSISVAIIRRRASLAIAMAISAVVMVITSSQHIRKIALPTVI